MIILKYEDYLTEKKMIDIFKQLQYHVNIDIKVNVKIGQRYRGDLVINDKYLVEFDGYRHYTDTSTILRDIYKDALWLDLKEDNRVIRIPYFIQLDGGTLFNYFGELLEELNLSYEDVEINNNYSHGFIDKKALLPANFCILGIRKFISDYNRSNKYVREIIANSLIKWVESKDLIEIFPIIAEEYDPFSGVLEMMREGMKEVDFSLYDYFSDNKKAPN